MQTAASESCAKFKNRSDKKVVGALTRSKNNKRTVKFFYVDGSAIAPYINVSRQNRARKKSANSLR
jgi:hypothetical protein